jgi:hypothetical protein
VLEFNMRADNISDLPFPVGTMLTQDQVPVLKKYNRHDVSRPRQFYTTAPSDPFPRRTDARYQRDFMNHNDTKIGKDYFVMEAGRSRRRLLRLRSVNGRTPRQTKRPRSTLRDAILPWISFQQSEFTRVLEWLKDQTITETKGVFTDLTATGQWVHVRLWPWGNPRERGDQIR